MCISSTPIEGPDIEWIPLLTEEIYLMVPENHHLAGRESIDLEEVKNEAFISSNTGLGVRSITDYYCREAGFVPRVSFEGDETMVIAKLVQQGLGVAFVPALIWHIAPHKSVSLLRIKKPVCERTIGAGRSKRRHPSIAASNFFEHVIDYFADISSRITKNI